MNSGKVPNMPHIPPPPVIERKEECCDKNLTLRQEFEEILRLLANVRGKVLSLERKLIKS